MQKTFTKITLAVLAFLSVLTVKAQSPTTCSLAASYSYPISQTVSGYTDSYYWFQVTLGSGNYKIAVNSASSVNKINRADVYTGSCSSLSLYATDTLNNSGDSSFFIPITNTVSTSYYVRLSNVGSPTTFTVNTTVYCWIVGNLGFCPGQQVQLTTILGNASGTSTYSWSPSTGLSSTNTPTTTATTTAAITYTLTYNDANGTYTNTAMVVPLPTSDCNSCEMTINGSFEAIQGESNTNNNVGQPSAVETACGSITYFDPSNWIAPTCGTSDYFNANYLPQGGNGVYVPTNFMTASTPANSGNGYAGFFTATAPIGSNYREYVQEQLKCGLVTGQLYNVSMYTSLAEYAHYATNNIGAYLSVTSVTNTATAATNLPYTPQINSNSVVTTYGTWAQITGTITGNGEQYITVGNFYDDTHTTYTTSTSPNAHANHFSYYFIDDISVTPATPTLSATSACSGSTFTLTATGCASAYTTWQGPNSYTASGSVISAPTPTANGTYTCTVNLSSVCPTCAPITQTINISVAPTITIVASPTTICVNQSSTVTASGASSYSWSPSSGLSATTGSVVTASPTVTTTYSIAGTGTNSCVGTNTVVLTVSGCTVCPSCTSVLSGTVSGSPATGGSYCINNNITILGNITFGSSEFKIAPGVVITIAPSSSLSISASHLYACSNMWQGIVVPSTSTVSVSSNSLIEDAYVAITSTTTTQNQMANVGINQSIFNKNQVSLQMVSTDVIVPPSGSTYPISVNNSVFTSRTFTFTSTSWPSVSTVTTASTMPSPLQSPYLNAYSTTQCKNGSYPVHAIELTNVGVTTGALSSPSYTETLLGGTNFNLYDTHYYGVYATNSNVSIENSVFQNMLWNRPNQYFGVAVYAHSTDDDVTKENYRVQIVPIPGSTYSSTFYNVYSMLDMYHYLETNVNHCNAYSTAATYTVGAPPDHMVGQTGIYLYTNRYHNLTVDKNNFYNIGAPIVFTADIGNYNGTGGVTSGRWGGQVNFTNNYMRPHVYPNTITNQFINLGIYAQDVMSTPTSYTNNTEPTTNINISNNSLSNVWNGISASNFALQSVSTSTNYVSIVDASNEAVTPTGQFGISNTNILQSSTINYNNIVSNVSSSNQSKAITTASNATVSVQCNDETGAWRGIEFNGTQAGTFVGNQLTNNTYGMVLDNSGKLGTQGSSTNPRWNQWIGTWGSGLTSTPFKTYTAGSSSAQNSIMWIKNTGNYNPDGNGGTTGVLGTTSFSGDNYYGNTTYVSPTIGYGSYFGTWTCPASVATCTNCRGSQPAMTSEDSVDVINVRQLMEKLVTNAIHYDANDSTINRYLDRMFVYRKLRVDTMPMFGSQILRTYRSIMQNSHIEKLFNIEDAFTNGDITTAQSLSSAFSPANQIETNYLNYYNILTNYKQQVMTGSDSSNLYLLAKACPYTDGSVVYQARALYNVINTPLTVFTNNCNDNISNRVASTNISESVNAFDAYIYPNPNAGKELFITSVGLITGSLQIKLTDLEGRVVYENNCSVADGSVNLKITDITNGVYFVHITNTATGEKVIKKLIIQY